jgi:lysosomal Pro-X carboxypeptidase
MDLTDAGKAWLKGNWNLCTQLKGNESIATLKEYLSNVWTNLAMVNYPYPANFLSPLPAYPVKVRFEMCSII